MSDSQGSGQVEKSEKEKEVEKRTRQQVDLARKIIRGPISRSDYTRAPAR